MRSAPGTRPAGAGLIRRALLALPAALLAGPAEVGIDVLSDPATRARDLPFTVGIVLPEGALPDPGRGALWDAVGRPVAFESTPTAWWNEGRTHVKWLRLRFRADPGQRYRFVPGGGPLRPAGGPLAVAQGGAVEVDTGPLRVRLEDGRPVLFTAAFLRGVPQLAAAQPEFALGLADGHGVAPTTLRGWTVRIEESTPLFASVKAEGFFHGESGLSVPGRPVARLEVRYEFFRGESHARVFHTLTWMIANPEAGARRLAVGLQPVAALRGRARLGVTDPGEDVDTAWPAAELLEGLQDEAERFTVSRGAERVAAGWRLMGWIGAAGEGGDGITVTLRHAWQMYPKAFSAGPAGLAVELWPLRAPALSFAPRELLTPEYFRHPVWQMHPWSRAAGHFVHERAALEFFRYTAEGAARTHELVVHFHGAGAPRPPAEVTVLTLRPPALRQDPASAMRVPFMGFLLPPVRPDLRPDLERALDTLGRMSVARWSSTHDYGFWRFGFTRWGMPPPVDQGNSLYRWMDGGQYDQALIPWLLFLRGGDRQFLEEAEITSRFLMDVGVNHFNSLGHPTGYMATAGGTPFPYIPYHTTKGTKIHFLAHHHHLTGYQRAREVMETVIAGTLATAAREPAELPRWYRRTGGREAYNLNVFWVNAWHETWDPRVRRFADEWQDLSARREFVPELEEFRPPWVYLYNGLVLQHRRSGDPGLRDAMLRNLHRTILTPPEAGGERRIENMIGAQWAVEQTGDARFARLAADVAHSLADVVPDIDLSGSGPPPYSVRGNEFYRQFVLPLLVGAALGEPGSSAPGVPSRRDTFFSLDPGARVGRASAAIFVRPARAGDLEVLLRLARAGETVIRVTARDGAGRLVATGELQARAPVAQRTEGEGYEVLQARPALLALRLPGVRAGAVYRLDLEGFPASATALVLAEAQVVHALGPGGALGVQDLAGQYYGGARFFTRAAEDVVTVVSRNPGRSPYSVRDAVTGELLFRSRAGEDATQRISVGRGRRLAFIVGSFHPHSEKRFSGIEPFVAASGADWFDPR